MPTIRIYREDQYASSCDSVVTEVREKNGFDLISCRESVFYPEGGGQPSDIGTVSLGNSVYEVTHASDESIDSDVWHLTDAPSGTFNVGDEISLNIDYDFRFRNMQRHLGEHMLSGVIYSMFDGANKGFHIGENYVTIDIDLGGRMMSEEELDLAERTVNDAIWADLSVSVDWYNTFEDTEGLPMRKRIPHEGRISVVTVGDPEDPFDCMACCGVHPSRTSEVGLLSIYKCESNKGMSRIFFDCGACAMDKLTTDSHILRDIAAGYSCSATDVPSRMASEAEAVSELKARLADMTAYVKENEKSSILKEIGESGANIHCYSSGILSTDDMLKMGFDVIHEADGLLLILINPAASTCLLLSSREDSKCGQLVKEHAQKFGGKGGGRDDNARAMFSSEDDMMAFIGEIKGIYA